MVDTQVADIAAERAAGTAAVDIEAVPVGADTAVVAAVDIVAERAAGIVAVAAVGIVAVAAVGIAAVPAEVGREPAAGVAGTEVEPEVEVADLG